jgi:hypothetical protein
MTRILVACLFVGGVSCTFIGTEGDYKEAHISQKWDGVVELNKRSANGIQTWEPEENAKNSYELRFFMALESSNKEECRDSTKNGYELEVYADQGGLPSRIWSKKLSQESVAFSKNPMTVSLPAGAYGFTLEANYLGLPQCDWVILGKPQVYDKLTGKVVLDLYSVSGLQV